LAATNACNESERENVLVKGGTCLELGVSLGVLHGDAGLVRLRGGGGSGLLRGHLLRLQVQALRESSLLGGGDRLDLGGRGLVGERGTGEERYS